MTVVKSNAQSSGRLLVTLRLAPSVPFAVFVSPATFVNVVGDLAAYALPQSPTNVASTPLVSHYRYVKN